LAFTDTDPGALDYFEPYRPGHWLCDLAGLAQRVLERHGVGAVFRDRHCSYRNADLFYSYRRDGVTGRMAALIWINKSSLQQG
jgi:copper oxidase (laccase) domain-containing protein